MSILEAGLAHSLNTLLETSPDMTIQELADSIGAIGGALVTSASDDWGADSIPDLSAMLDVLRAAYPDESDCLTKDEAFEMADDMLSGYGEPSAGYWTYCWSDGTRHIMALVDADVRLANPLDDYDDIDEQGLDDA